MNNRDFNTCLKNRQLLIGAILSLPSPETAEILANSGLDWLFVDAEHSPFSELDIQRILQATAEKCACLVRVPALDEAWIKRVLDTGAAGIIIPMVNSAEVAERIVQLAKYPPQGKRSIGIGRAHGYGATFNDFVPVANQQISIVIQVEHILGVENIEAILNVKGIDAIFIGPYDLSASMGLTGQLDHPEVQAAMEKVRKACQRHEIPVGSFTLSLDVGRSFIKEGDTLVTIGTDASFLHSGARAIVALKGRP